MMETKIKIKECFGYQGGKILGGESADECWDCGLFERCHKVSITTSFEGMAFDFNLVVQNGLRLRWLESFRELDRLDPAREYS